MLVFPTRGQACSFSFLSMWNRTPNTRLLSLMAERASEWVEGHWLIDQVPEQQASSLQKFSPRPVNQGGSACPRFQRERALWAWSQQTRGNTAVGETWDTFNLAPFELGCKSATASQGPPPLVYHSQSLPSPNEKGSGCLRCCGPWGPLLSDSGPPTLPETRTAPGDS